ncbi:MAG: hypothetical protein WC357_04455 [Candidatus Omnitrophota bacterium]|jgi:hypothetical protein
MKKVLFVILALCFAGTLALAEEMTKPVDEEVVVVTEESSPVVAGSDESKDMTDVAAATDASKDETAVQCTAEETDTTMKE